MPVIHVEQISQKPSRFRIRNVLREFWTGCSWSKRPREARLYNDQREVENEAHLMQEACRQRFRGSVTIEVSSLEAVNIDALRRCIDEDEPRLPEDELAAVLDHAEILVSIDWETLGETTRR